MRVQIVSEGRGGTVRFENEHTSFNMWWEFAGSSALAIIGLPSRQHWEAETKLPLEQRANTLRFIGEHIVKAQTSGRGSYCYDDQTMTIYSDDTAKNSSP